MKTEERMSISISLLECIVASRIGALGPANFKIVADTMNGKPPAGKTPVALMARSMPDPVGAWPGPIFEKVSVDTIICDYLCYASFGGDLDLLAREIDEAIASELCGQYEAWVECQEWFGRCPEEWVGDCPEICNLKNRLFVQDYLACALSGESPAKEH